MLRLIIVIIVLAIVSITAYIKMLNFQSDTRRAALKTIVSTMHTMSGIVYTKSLLRGVDSSCFVYIEDIYTCGGYPTAHIDNIKRAFDIDESLNLSNNGTDENGRTATLSFKQKSRCYITYSDMRVTGTYEVKLVDSDC
ncbi:histidine kinase [Photobacterium profundum]|uniref:Signal transduction histidine kinase n=1 Tax=Photobacterium profundum 3TCK TaxID=314280 RepID=Q1Z3J4_9GAMM|nr:hypothetical protein [Photobacterium profundum]EAS43012.1 Signal transduction histidine kinase [Photobacterium profundum 3TCK]PSV62028.1 histidine kinase [Photobacterium profundum]